MSESVSFETTVIAETQPQSQEIANRADEYFAAKDKAKDQEWGGALTALVEVHADVLVRCSWMGGAVVTVSEAMTSYNYPPNLTAEDEPFLISLVHELLANRVAETEEPEEENLKEDESEEKEPSKAEKTDPETKTEAKREPENPSQLEAEVHLKKNIDKEKSLQESLEREAESSATKDTSAPEVKTGRLAEIVQNKAKPSTNSAAKIEKATSSTSSSVDGVSSNASSATDELVKLPPKRGQLAVKQTNETLTLPEPIETSEVTHAEEKLTSESESLLPQTENMDVNTKILDEEEPMLLSLDEQMHTDIPADSVEEELLIDRFQETDNDSDEQYEYYELPMPEISINAKELEAGITEGEPLFEGNLTIEEVEDSLILMAESIGVSEPEKLKKVDEILDKIIEVAEAETNEFEEVFTEADAEQELKVLFTELFDEMGIGYTPELIESLAHLTHSWHLAEDIRELKAKEEIDQTPQDSGTREIIKKLLVYISNLKKAVAHACEIGKSALQLYRFSLAA